MIVGVFWCLKRATFFRSFNRSRSLEPTLQPTLGKKRLKKGEFVFKKIQEKVEILAKQGNQLRKLKCVIIPVALQHPRGKSISKTIFPITCFDHTEGQVRSISEVITAAVATILLLALHAAIAGKNFYSQFTGKCVEIALVLHGKCCC